MSWSLSCLGPCPGPLSEFPIRPISCFGYALLERGSRRAICRSQSSLKSCLLQVGHALDVLLHVLFTAAWYVVLASVTLIWTSASSASSSTGCQTSCQQDHPIWLCSPRLHTLSSVPSRRRCLRVRQFSSASAELTSTSQFVACLKNTLACPSADPHVRLHTFTRVLRVVWGDPSPIVPPRSARVDAVSSRARLLRFVVGLRHGRELRRAACVTFLVRRRERIVAEPLPPRSALCTFRRALHCSVTAIVH